MQKSDFSKKYQNFLNEHVKINSKPCVITKVNLPKSGGYVHKNHLSKKDKNYGMPKSKKMDLIPLAKVMKQLGKLI